MTYTVRITGPGIDHTALITGAEDVEAARAVLDKIEREFDGKTITRDIDPVTIARCPRCGSLPRPTLMGRTICVHCGGLDVSQPLPSHSSGGGEHGA